MVLIWQTDCSCESQGILESFFFFFSALAAQWRWKSRDSNSGSDTSVFVAKHVSQVGEHETVLFCLTANEGDQVRRRIL